MLGAGAHAQRSTRGQWMKGLTYSTKSPEHGHTIAVELMATEV
jgi:hypothetical protein